MTVAVIVLTLSGCVNPYTQFYTDRLGGRAVTSIPWIVPSSEEPKVYTTVDHDRDTRAMLENGYLLIGFSSFNAGNASQAQAIEHARNVGAAVVLLQSKYTNTVSGSIPWTVQNPSQTVTT
jgi:hypothetical protein